MTMPTLRTLIVEDRPDDAELLVAELSRGGYTPHWTRVDTLGDLIARVQDDAPDVVITDYSLPGMDASVETEIMDPVNSGVLVFLRRAPTQTIVGVYNVTPDPQTLPRWVIALNSQAWDALTEDTPLSDADLKVEPYQARWFVQQT